MAKPREGDPATRDQELSDTTPMRSQGSSSQVPFAPAERSGSPLDILPAAADAITRTVATGIMPCRSDPCWGGAPWAFMDRERTERCLRNMDASSRPTRRLRLAVLMTVAVQGIERWASSGTWLVREWLRALTLPFIEREAVERLVLAARYGRMSELGRCPGPLAGSIDRAQLGALVRALGFVPCPSVAPDRASARDLDGQPPRATRAAPGAGITSGVAEGRERGGHLWLMVGIPASGKSTWLRNRGVGHVVSMDVIRLELAGDMGDQRRNDEVFHMAICALKRSLASVSDVAFDATNIDRDARRVPLEAAAARGARVTAVFLDTPFRVCASRNAARRRRVPVDVVLRFAQRLVPPMPYECDDRLVISCT